MAAEPRNHRHPVPATPGAVSAAESAAFAGHAEPIALDMPDGAVAPESPLPPPEELQGWWQDVLVYVVLFVISLAGVVLALRWLLKPIPDDQWAVLRFPTTLEHAQQIGDVLDDFRDKHFLRALAAHAIAFIFLQAFAIPGTTFANLIGGALFGRLLGFFVCILWSTTGATVLYFNSKWLFHRAVHHFFPSRLHMFRIWIHDNESHLLIRLMGLRVFPFTPNWFVNIACAQLRVPLRVYIPASFLGLAPYTFVGCQAGTILEDLKSTHDIMEPRVVWGLVLLAAAGFALPFVLKSSAISAPPTRPKKE